MQRAGWYNTHVIPPVIISASRRTDVPAFHADWFSACLSSGIATFRNPYTGRPSQRPLAGCAPAALAGHPGTSAPPPPAARVACTAMPRDDRPAMTKRYSIREVPAGAGKGHSGGVLE